MCRCEDRVVQRLEQDFKVTLQQQNSLEQWAAWLDGVVSQVLKPYQGSSGFPKAAKLFLLKWSFYRCAGAGRGHWRATPRTWRGREAPPSRVGGTRGCPAHCRSHLVEPDGPSQDRAGIEKLHLRTRRSRPVGGPSGGARRHLPGVGGPREARGAVRHLPEWAGPSEATPPSYWQGSRLPVCGSQADCFS